MQTFKDAQGPLASSLASVQVDFNTVEFPDSPDTFQNDGVSGRDRKSNQDTLTDILIGIPLNDDKKANGDSPYNKHGILALHPLRSSSTTTALEIGMYVLLTTFCFAILVFVVSCFVYASKHKMINFENSKSERPAVAGKVAANATTAGHFPMLRETRRNRESTTNAHNWVWLGRSTMDRSSMVQEGNDHVMSQRGNKITVTMHGQLLFKKNRVEFCF